MWVQRNLEILGPVSERFRLFGLFPKHPCCARLGPNNTNPTEGVVIENQPFPVPILGLDSKADSFPHS